MKISKLRLLILAFIISFQSPNVGQSTMYAYIDSNGNRHYMDISAKKDKIQALASKIKWTSGKRKHLLVTNSIKLNDQPVIVPGKFNGLIDQAAQLHNVDPLLVKAVIKAESNFDPTATSPKGARGLMQLMPGTARDMNVDDPYDPEQNILGGTKYLGQMISTYNGNVVLGLAAYNAGPGRVTQSGMTHYIPETHEYVRRVIGNYRTLRRATVLPLSQKEHY